MALWKHNWIPYTTLDGITFMAYADEYLIITYESNHYMAVLDRDKLIELADFFILYKFNPSLKKWDLLTGDPRDKHDESLINDEIKFINGELEFSLIYEIPELEKSLIDRIINYINTPYQKSELI